jgi:cephalosporin-C deacetylase-like acetyl esterase
MHLPDDFGLSPVRTLAHVADVTPSPLHQGFWNVWQSAVFALTPRLVERGTKERDPSDPGADHAFESLAHARIGCRLVLPPKGQRVLGGVVVTHGYSTPPTLTDQAEELAPLVKAGLAVLCVRVRGYPGSQSDTPTWNQDPLGYIARGLEAFTGKTETLLAWSVPRAVADVVCAYRALRDRIGPGLPIAISGRSFGAGLGVIAAAQLVGKDEIARLCIAVPSLGDWAWRLSRTAAPGSAGRHMADAINAIARGQPERENQLFEATRVCDAVVHASRLRCPSLCMLAERDEVVPAPTAAAVCNALAAEPGRKWRFVVPAGHHDAGIRNARRIALFERCALEFLDLTRDVGRTMEPWDACMASGERGPEGASA